MSRADNEKVFRKFLGVNETIWLGEGCVGDDTHGHIDDVARCSSPETVLLAHEEGRPVHALVSESRPMNEGKGLATTLAERGIDTWFAVDGALPLLLPQAGVFLLPVAQALRDRLGLPLQLGEIPGRGSLVEPVPGELLDDEKRRKLCDLVHGELEVRNMVERAAGDDHVERRGGSELFECHALEDRPFRRDRIDRSDVVAARERCLDRVAAEELRSTEDEDPHRSLSRGGGSVTEYE